MKLTQHAQTLRKANPENSPMPLQWIAEQLWPDATWLKNRPGHGHGGPRTGARVAAGIAGRMERQGLLSLENGKDMRRYVLTDSAL